MTDHIVAAFVFFWFCFGWPGLCFLFGRMIGKHGWRHALFLILTKITPVGMEEVKRDATEPG